MMTDEHVLTESLDRVRRGSLGRREFTRGLLALGLTPPLIAELLRSGGVAHAQPKRGAFAPTRVVNPGNVAVGLHTAPYTPCAIGGPATRERNSAEPLRSLPSISTSVSSYWPKIRPLRR